MKKTTELLIYGTAFAAMALIAPYAFADNLTQSGAGNMAQQDVGNIYGNGNNSPGSNSPTLTATGGSSRSDSTAVSVSNSSSHSNQHQSQHQTQGQIATGGSVEGSGNSSADNQGNSQSVNENYKRNPVSSAFSAPLVAADDTCMGSSSAGGQAVGFGLSVGSTWRDADCVRRKDARELHNMGLKKAAVALMCQSDDVRNAMEAAGEHCPGATETEHKHASGESQDVTYDYPTSHRR